MNRANPAKFESKNVVMEVHSLEDARIVVRDLAENWAARKNFFLCAFQKPSDEFVAQIYIGLTYWDLPEFEVGYFAGIGHQGQGYVTEALKKPLQLIFEHLKAHRIVSAWNVKIQISQVFGWPNAADLSKKGISVKIRSMPPEILADQ